MKLKKLNKGYYHEITDRISVEQDNIENNLIAHPAIKKNKKLLKRARKAQKLLGKIYQITALKY